MKKLSLVLILAFTMSFVYAQKGKINSAYSSARSGKLNKALELLEKGIQHRKCIEWPKSYFVKGVVYQSIFETPIPAFKKLSEQPLETAYEAYKKCIELDKKERYSKKMIPYYKNLKIDFSNQGAKLFNESKLEEALKSFKNVLEINDSKILKKEKVIDTAIIYYTALTSYKLAKYKEAITLYEKVLNYGYEPAKCYAALADSYTKMGDKEKGMKYLHEGYEKFPNNLYMLGQLINYYLLGGEPEKAEKYLDAAIEKEPTNISFYRAKGTLYEKLKRLDDAIKMYDKALEIDPNDFISIYNKGLVKYNKVVSHHTKVRDIADDEEYLKQIKIVLSEYEELIPDFEKAHKVNPKEIAPVIVLKELYTKLRTKNEEFMAKFKYYSNLKKEMESK
ncbi:tetratricopeptide repeat protein [Marinilabiliaceae bacterium JC040]|nr:tetratricopeptide repeat protein [Marinilabiliaceae bacterium JC040]